jgi:hypothetical protein
VDTLGKLRWLSGDLDGDHLVCVVSERVPADYGVNPARHTAVPLKLKSVEQRANDTLWIRYTVVRP